MTDHTKTSNTDNGLTDQQLADIEARANAATPGPWFPHADWPGRVFAESEFNAHVARVTGSNPEPNEKFIAAARSDVPVLLAEVRRLRDRVAELEAFAYGCDAEGCTIPHSSWCDAAKKTAAANDGCTCGKPWTGHPQPHAMHCWTVNPPRSEIDEMRRALAEQRTKTLCTEADEIVAHCPDHGPQEQPTAWMSCHCPVADDMRRRAVSAVSGAADSRQA